MLFLSKVSITIFNNLLTSKVSFVHINSINRVAYCIILTSKVIENFDLNTNDCIKSSLLFPKIICQNNIVVVVRIIAQLVTSQLSKDIVYGQESLCVYKSIRDLSSIIHKYIFSIMVMMMMI